MNVKLINLCQYTVDQSLYDVGVYEEFQTLEERMNAQEFIENLNEVNNGNWKVIRNKRFKHNKIN